MNNRNPVSLFVALVLSSVVLLVPFAATGEVVRNGQWPAQENVTLSLEAAPRSEALQRLADAAGWSLIAEGVNETPVSLDVRAQPADKVLTLLLSGGDFIVERDGTLVSVRPAVNAETPVTKHVQTPSGKAEEDLFITEEGYVGKDQVVRDLFVVGSAVVEGTVTGSVVVFGGKAKLTRGARVSKDVVAFGGSLEIEDGVEVGGDVAALFGTMRRGEGPKEQCVTCVDEKQEPWRAFFSELFSNLTRALLAWLIGAIMIALATLRVNLLREEIERRPLRSLGVGVLTFVAGLLVLVTLIVTLIGIPLAILTAVVGVAATYLAFSALPLAVGRRLLGKRSDNPYVQLAAGCGALFVVLCIPVVGALVSVAGALITLGALSSTRVAGLFRRTGVSQGG